jgi:hypothetical protein
MLEFTRGLAAQVGSYLPNLAAAVLILVGGWLLALLVSATVRKAFEKTSFDNRLATRMGMAPTKVTSLEAVIGKTVYYLILLFVLVAVFQTLQLTFIIGPLNSLLEEVFAFVPNLLATAVLVFVAWLLATFLRFIVTKGLGATKLDDTLTQQVGVRQEGQLPMSETIGAVIYWFVLLLFLPAILDTLELGGLLAPVQLMLTNVLSYLPSVVGSLLILVIGWLVARVVRQIVTNFLAAVGTDRLGDRIGIGTATGGQALSAIIGTVVYVLVFIPVIIAALQALAIEAISVPATNMLNTLLNAVPLIFGAMVVLGVTYFIARLVAGLITSLLTSVGFNRVLNLIGLGRVTQEGQRTPAEVVGYLVLVGLMLFAVIEAANLLGFEIVAVLVANFLEFAAQVMLGIVILGVGLYLANLARSVILSTVRNQAELLSRIAQVAIIVLSTAMALREMGLANDIVNLAFGLLLGAVAVAAALAFGLGARDVAGREVEALFKRMHSTVTGPDFKISAPPTSTISTKIERVP